MSKIINANHNEYHISGAGCQSNIVMFDRPKLVCIRGQFRNVYGISIITKVEKNCDDKDRFVSTRIPLVGELLQPVGTLTGSCEFVIPEDKVLSPELFKRCIEASEHFYCIDATLDEMKDEAISVLQLEGEMTVNVCCYDDTVFAHNDYFNLKFEMYENGSYVAPNEFMNICRIVGFLGCKVKFVPVEETEENRRITAEFERMMQTAEEFGIMDNNLSDTVYNDGEYSYSKGLGRVRMTREEYLAKFPDAFKLL